MSTQFDTYVQGTFMFLTLVRVDTVRPLTAPQGNSIHFSVTCVCTAITSATMDLRLNHGVAGRRGSAD
ncbi:hypothetical protein AB1N83_007895 [Pleurotus pulmonarius]